MLLAGICSDERLRGDADGLRRSDDHDFEHDHDDADSDRCVLYGQLDSGRSEFLCHHYGGRLQSSEFGLARSWYGLR